MSWIAMSTVASSADATPNPQFQGSAEQQRCSVPVTLRVPAPPELQRYVSPSATDISLRAAIGHVDACKRILVGRWTLELHYHYVCADLGM
jgi:hypothetical protein